MQLARLLPTERAFEGCRTALLGVVVVASVLHVAAASAASASSLCAAAIAATEQAEHLPRGLLAAIGRVESGRPSGAARGAILPWPWTINVEGAGHFYATKSEAVAAALAFQQRGIRSIDVGCLQVNLAYHETAFRDLNEAFEPATNVAYGARFLKQLFAATGNWETAAAAYHSQTPNLGAKYRERVLAAWGRGGPAPGCKDTAVAADRSSSYGRWPPTGVAYAAFPPVEFAYRALAPRPTWFGASAAPASSDAGVCLERRPPTSASSAGRHAIARSRPWVSNAR